MAPVYFSTLLPRLLPTPPLYNMATPAAGLSPVAPMFSQASILFPLLGNPFSLVHWANSALSWKFQLKCFLLCYTVTLFPLLCFHSITIRHSFIQPGFTEHLLLLLLLLLLSHFSRVPLCATPETAAHQAPPSLGFSRQEHWSGMPFPPPVHESEK